MLFQKQLERKISNFNIFDNIFDNIQKYVLYQIKVQRPWL